MKENLVSSIHFIWTSQWANLEWIVSFASCGNHPASSSIVQVSSRLEELQKEYHKGPEGSSETSSIKRHQALISKTMSRVGSRVISNLTADKKWQAWSLVVKQSNTLLQLVCTLYREWPSFVHPVVALFFFAFINGRGVTPFNYGGAAELLMLLSSLDKCTYIWIWMDRYSRVMFRCFLWESVIYQYMLPVSTIVELQCFFLFLSISIQ